MNKIYKKDNWYILKIYSKDIKTIITKIKKILKKNKVKNYKILNFFKKKRKYINYKTYISYTNLLPGYLIIYLSLNNDLLYKIKSIHGVISFLNISKNKYPIALTYNEIKKFIKNIKKSSETKFEKGDIIIITKGVFLGISGKIQKIYKKENKILFTTYIMGRKTPIIINLKYVKKK
ncbi:MAG: hypothetical protein NHG14_00030 [Candidatus Shikimatogenerans bostrichidophilus]|nr:MAG: hypothetical protein NHG14_00030 [Candidatus Shikimatogenerans bostrichidophilus]